MAASQMSTRCLRMSYASVKSMRNPYKNLKCHRTAGRIVCIKWNNENGWNNEINGEIFQTLIPVLNESLEKKFQTNGYQSERHSRVITLLWLFSEWFYLSFKVINIVLVNFSSLNIFFWSIGTTKKEGKFFDEPSDEGEKGNQPEWKGKPDVSRR
ncbi:UNVERIFIED_CONTAM: hypothetical protein PYX00_005843 [Menopon gallinae]|uniref:Uncharacterized protein n=1 Tax=Menopon gallinae TaxID=328185 RepID=A0AAW2HV03_9NEOP